MGVAEEWVKWEAKHEWALVRVSGCRCVGGCQAGRGQCGRANNIELCTMAHWPLLRTLRVLVCASGRGIWGGAAAAVETTGGGTQQGIGYQLLWLLVGAYEESIAREARRGAPQALREREANINACWRACLREEDGRAMGERGGGGGG